jgi:hypothetical protein
VDFGKDEEAIGHAYGDEQTLLPQGVTRPAHWQPGQPRPVSVDVGEMLRRIQVARGYLTKEANLGRTDLQEDRKRSVIAHLANILIRPLIAGLLGVLRVLVHWETGKANLGKADLQEDRKLSVIGHLAFILIRPLIARLLGVLRVLGHGPAPEGGERPVSAPVHEGIEALHQPDQLQQ